MRIKNLTIMLVFILVGAVVMAGCFGEDESCRDECNSGARECYGNGYRACGQYDSDECLEWSSIACGPDEVCIDAVCENIEEVSTATMSLRITDGCNDGYRIEYRFFDVDHDLVWPGGGQYYYTEQYGQEYQSSFSCIPGAKICYGANTGETYWGVSLEGDKGCEDCCYYCTDGASYGWNLTCN